MDTTKNNDPLVLHVRSVTGFGGGPEKTILNSPRFLRGLGYRCACAYMHPPADKGFALLQQRAADANAELISVSDRGAWDWRVLTRLIHTCRQRRVAIWHGHDYKSNAFGLIVRRFWPMKLVTTLHGWVEHTRRTPLYYRIDRSCITRYDEVLCVSEDLHESALQCGVKPERCRVIHNAIDTEIYTRSALPATSALVASTPDSLRPISLGAMGRLSNEKGFDLLIRAVAKLKAQGLKCHLKIAGDGPLLKELTDLVREMQCETEIELIGQVADNKAFFDSLDIFVLSSRREGLPNVLLEAMAMQVPVVATGIAGIPRLIQSGANGILVPPDSVEELAGAVQKLMQEPELRKQLADAGRATIEHSYSFQRRMERVAAIYDQVLGRGPIRSLVVPSGDRIRLVPGSDRVQSIFSSEYTGK